MRNKRILWAGTCCLLDNSSGAAQTINTILNELASRNFDITVIGATIFDVPDGLQRLNIDTQRLPDDALILKIPNGCFEHQLVRTKYPARDLFSAAEQTIWLSLYHEQIEIFKPDMIFYFGGKTLELVASNIAEILGIPVVTYLANGSYLGIDWCRSVDLILTDSNATAKYYEDQSGLSCIPIGKFIKKDDYVSIKASERKYLTFINPSLSKGAYIVYALASLLDCIAPSIEIKVIESRGTWSELHKEFIEDFPDAHIPTNIIIQSQTNDMAEVYRETKILIAPSLWWESSGRVLAEAILAGIPCIITKRGGMPEMIGDAGLVLELDEDMYEPPYKSVPSDETLNAIAEWIIDLYEDDTRYNALVKVALETSLKKHDLSKNMDRLCDILKPYLDLQAGDNNFAERWRDKHQSLFSGAGTTR